MKVVIVKGIEIGSGPVKIAVPLVGKTEWQIVDEVKALKNEEFDIVEWRVDHFENVSNLDLVTKMAKHIRDLLPQSPILFTFRTKKEGGVKDISLEDYINLNRKIAETKLVDLLDFELFMGDEPARKIVDAAHANNVPVIMSNHDFAKTPTSKEIITRLCKMQELGADIAKIAVTPLQKKDVLVLLSSVLEMNETYAKVPLVAISMGEMGIISRIAGNLFGSALTFGAVKNISAPGQINATKLRSLLKILHGALAD